MFFLLFLLNWIYWILLKSAYLLIKLKEMFKRKNKLGVTVVIATYETLYY